MKKQGILAMVLVIVLLSFPLVSCSNTGSKGTEDGASTPAEGTPEATKPASVKTNVFGWEVPEKTLEITAFNAGGNYAPSEEQKTGRENMEKYILENFNVKLTMQTTDGDGTEALNLALASNTYPEIIYWMGYNMVLKFKEQGKAQDLTPYMDTIGKDIKEKCAETYPLLLDDDGKLYYLPIEQGALMELPDYSAHIRYDEWQQIGSPDIKTPDDYYNALKKILEASPKTPNGDARYAMSLYNTMDYPVNFSGYWGLKRGWKIDDNGTFTNWAFTDEGKEMTRWFNQIYRDGLFDPDAFNNTFDDWKAKFSSEKIAGAIGGWWISWNAGHEVWQTLDPNTPEDKRYIQVSFRAPEAEAAYLTGKQKYGNGYTIITDKAKDVESIMKFIDFQATEKGLALFNWGIPNGVTSYKDPARQVKEWNIDENGNWSFDEEAKKQFVNETWDYNDEAVVGNGTYNFFSSSNRWSDGEYCIWGNQMWYSENKWKTIMMNNMKGTIYDATPMILRQKDENVTLTETAISDAWKQGWPTCVQSNSDEEFEANWTALQQAMTGAGIETYTRVMEENYQNNMEKLSK